MKRVKVYSYPNGMVLMVAKNHGYDRNKSNVRFWKSTWNLQRFCIEHLEEALEIRNNRPAPLNKKSRSTSGKD